MWLKQILSASAAVAVVPAVGVAHAATITGRYTPAWTTAMSLWSVATAWSPGPTA